MTNMLLHFHSLPNILQHFTDIGGEEFVIFSSGQNNKKRNVYYLYSGTIPNILKKEIALQIPLKMLFVLFPFLFSLFHP